MEIALVAIAALVGATLQSATGFGFALLLGPAVFAVLDPGNAIVALLAAGALLSFLVLFTERRAREVRSAELGLLLPFCLPGLVLGAVILAALDQGSLQVLVGLGVLLAVAFQFRVPPQHSPSPEHPVALYAATGLVTGILTTTTSTNGPPLVLLFQRFGYSPAELRDSLAAAFLFLDLVGLVFAPFLIRSEEGLGAALAAVAVCTVVGQVLGRRVFVRLEPRTFRTAGIVLAALAGLASIAAGLAG